MEFDKIAAFIRRHHVMTVATVGSDGRPWCAHVFYAWMPDERRFVFTTDPATRHGTEMEAGAHVAAGIALETRIVGRVQGLQIEGEVRRPEDAGDTGGAAPEKVRRAYLKRFPYAAVMPDLALWTLEPTHLKLTDNTLGFGRKLIWTK